MCCNFSLVIAIFLSAGFSVTGFGTIFSCLAWIGEKSFAASFTLAFNHSRTTITSKGNFTSNGNANNSKESSSSSPKTGDSFPIVSILTAIGISAVSTVLFMKKRK